MDFTYEIGYRLHTLVDNPDKYMQLISRPYFYSDQHFPARAKDWQIHNWFETSEAV